VVHGAYYRREESMAVEPKSDVKVWFSDKKRLCKLMEEIDAKAGITFDPTVTVEKLREMLLAQGIRPEDNALSRDIIRAKYPDEESDEV
jgi:hypothetical protein